MDLQANFLAFCLILLSNPQVIPPALALCPAASDPHLESYDFNRRSSSVSEDETDKQWLERNGFCYRFVASQQPWYPAELVCRFWGGHLVSIRSVEENRLIGRLTGCRGAWIGRFATNFYRVAEPDSYEWTEDETTSGAHSGTSAAASVYSCHNVSSLPDRHAGALRAEQMAWVNTHYHERLPFVCKTASSSEGSGRCTAPLSQFNDHCYWLSDFFTSFVDASLHCERELGGHLASVQSPAEARFIASLELDTDSCQLSNVWIGLIRQNPCRRGGAPAGDNGPCYQWTDFSGEHINYPPWASGQQLGAENVAVGSDGSSELGDKIAWSMNCVTLSGDGLHSERCHSRRRFVCKVEQGKLHRVFTEPKTTASAVEEPGVGNEVSSKENENQ